MIMQVRHGLFVHKLRKFSQGMVPLNKLCKYIIQDLIINEKETKLLSLNQDIKN